MSANTTLTVNGRNFEIWDGIIITSDEIAFASFLNYIININNIMNLPNHNKFYR
jgi:hypothetical protein